jgi:hypothetical protein
MKAILEMNLPKNCMYCSCRRNVWMLNDDLHCQALGDMYGAYSKEFTKCLENNRRMNCPLKIIQS